MEQNNQDPVFELQVDHESRNHFKEAAKWGNFIAIIYFVGFGLFLLVMLFAGAMLMNSPTLSPEMEGATGVAGGGYVQILLGLGIFVFLLYAGIMLYRFASACRRGVETQDQVAFNIGLKALRNYFVCMGLLAILGLVSDALKIVNIL